jgi:hypothetical protein
MIKHLMRTGIGFTARKKRRINKMIKRNRHKTSYRSSKKVNPKRRALKKFNKKLRRTYQGGIE